MKCNVILALLCFYYSLHSRFSFLLAYTTQNAERSGNNFFSRCRCFIHDYWPYKMQLVGSRYMLIALFTFALLFVCFPMSFGYFYWNFLLSHLKKKKSFTEPTGEMRNSLWLLKHEWTFSITSKIFKMAKPTHQRSQNLFSSHTSKSPVSALAVSQQKFLVRRCTTTEEVIGKLAPTRMHFRAFVGLERDRMKTSFTSSFWQDK